MFSYVFLWHVDLFNFHYISYTDISNVSTEMLNIYSFFVIKYIMYEEIIPDYDQQTTEFYIKWNSDSKI